MESFIKQVSLFINPLIEHQDYNLVTIDKTIVNYQFTRGGDTHQTPLTGLTQHISIHNKSCIKWNLLKIDRF